MKDTIHPRAGDIRVVDLTAYAATGFTVPSSVPFVLPRAKKVPRSVRNGCRALVHRKLRVLPFIASIISSRLLLSEAAVIILAGRKRARRQALSWLHSTQRRVDIVLTLDRRALPLETRQVQR